MYFYHIILYYIILCYTYILYIYIYYMPIYIDSNIDITGIPNPAVFAVKTGAAPSRVSRIRLDNIISLTKKQVSIERKHQKHSTVEK